MRTLVDFVLGGVARQSRPTQDAADEEAEGCTSPNASNSRLRNGGSVASNQTGAMTIEPHSTPGWMQQSHTSWRTGGWKTGGPRLAGWLRCRWEEQTSELQSLMRISSADVCLKKKKARIQDPNAKTRCRIIKTN